MKNKALLYLRAKKDPSALLVEVLTEIEKLANIKLDKQAEESKEAITKLFKEEWGKLSTKATESIPVVLLPAHGGFLLRQYPAYKLTYPYQGKRYQKRSYNNQAPLHKGPSLANG